MPDPVIDPATGEPKKGNGGTPPDPPADGSVIQVPADEWIALKTKIDIFEKGFTHQPQPAPAAPTGPTFDEQISQIDKGIEAFDSQIDEAVANGKPVSALLRERDKLIQNRTRLHIKHEDIDPAFATGIDTINQLSDTVTRTQMPYLDLVKQDYDTALNSMPADQRMNPKIRQAAYNIAVGQNITKIMEAEHEKKLRESQEPDPPEPGSSSRASNADPDTVPKPEEVLSRDTMKALRMKGQTVDEYYKSVGYKDWADFWEKRGKEYFEG